MNAFNRLPWAPTDHSAGGKPSTDQDLFPGAQLRGKQLVDADGDAFFEFEPGTTGTNTVDAFTEKAAKQIAHAVLNRLSAW